jgi:hypothetical protein
MISSLNAAAFSDLESVQEINLSDNKIQRVADNVFDGLPELSNVYELTCSMCDHDSDFGGNPLVCKPTPPSSVVLFFVDNESLAPCS